jgi:hypothetical protein
LLLFNYDYICFISRRAREAAENSKPTATSIGIVDEDLRRQLEKAERQKVWFYW